jgi:hypothetical protein
MSPSVEVEPESGSREEGGPVFDSGADASRSLRLLEDSKAASGPRMDSPPDEPAEKKQVEAKSHSNDVLYYEYNPFLPVGEKVSVVAMKAAVQAVDLEDEDDFVLVQVDPKKPTA